MAARDWSQTPLGTPDTWPAELRNVVRILLTSRFSMWAAWGPELTFFYNDAYKHDTLQSKHPWALGRPFPEVWAEIWEELEPRIRSVLDTGVATWDEDLLLFLERSGYREESYHTFSYSPLEGDDGRTAGMLCVVTETTERVVGERRMAHLRDLAAAVATQRTEDGVLGTVADQLGRDPADLPFSAVYLFEADGGARLVATAGIGAGDPATPSSLRAGDPGSPWPLARIRTGQPVVVDDLGSRFAELPTGAWQQPPVQGVAVPLASSASGPDAVAGFLVVGLNPHRRYDDAYRGYLELIAGQIGAGLLNAAGYEAERRRAEALAELDRAKTDFFSNVSHEFRTPLTLIMGPVAELLGSPAASGDPRVREELEVIHRNSLRLGRLVNTLLDFSRIQAGRIEASFEPVDLAATTTELASVFRSAVTRAGLRFTVDCPALGEPVLVDRDMWEKVVLNLLSNALKFTFEGGITVRLERAGDTAVLSVADTGTGIPADQLPRLFERFSRVGGARARSGEGSGIGLAMVRELVTLHGGTVDVVSTPDVGTTFRVALPFGSAHLPADRIAEPSTDVPAVSPAAEPFVSEALRWLPGGPPAEEPAAAAAPGQPASGRVLVADDNADMREYLVRLLEPRYAVHAVSDGEEALHAALAEPPDLVISDVMMPRLDGMQLLAALRADARTARIPVLLLSARAGQEAAVEGLAAGADDYLVKPFSAQELLARVGAHLHLGRARREAEERFTAMADLAPALIWVADQSGHRVFVNRGWSAFTGQDASAELGHGWRDGLHPQDRDRYLETVEAATAQGRGWEVEFRLRRSDGAYHWLLERAVPIGAGESFAGHVGSCTDINARYRETERQSLLAEIGAALDRASDIDEQLGSLARLLVTARVADVCDVRRVGDDGRLSRVALAAADPQTEAVVGALDPETYDARAVIETGRSVLRRSLTEGEEAGPRYGEPAVAGLRRQLDVGTGLAVPLIVRDRVLAVLGLGRGGTAAGFNDDDRLLAEEIAARAALALDNALLIADERAAALRLGLLQRATAELSAATTPVEVARAAASHVRQLTGEGARVAVFELDAAHRALAALTIDGHAPGTPWATVGLHTPLAATAAVTERRPLWIEEAADWPGAGLLTGEQGADMRGFGLEAAVALPLIVAGRVVGVISIGFPAPRRFAAVERGMLLAVAEQCAQALDRARLYRAEQTIAETLQRSLLPQDLPRIARLALAAEYLPGAEGTSAGGDWYDVLELPGSEVAVAVGDVVGQGPAAAAVMGQLRSALSTALLQGCAPAEALELLDRFAARLPGALASTAACVVVDWRAGTLRWARAGHPPALLVTADGARLLGGGRAADEGAGPVLGVPDRAPYREATTDVVPGDTLLLYTDGLVERRGEHLDTGLDRLIATAGRLAAADPGTLTRELLDRLLAGADRPDDVAVIAVRLMPAPLTGRIPADPTRLSVVRRAVVRWSTRAGLSEDAAEDLQLALGEALANGVEHAYPGAEDGECRYSVERAADGSIEVCVEDDGVWRPPPADRGHRGRGLELIRALGVDVEVGRTAGSGRPASGTTVRFRLAAPAATAPVQRRERLDVLPDGAARLEVGEDADGVVLAVLGELDLATAAGVRAALHERLGALPRGAVATVDLRRTGYLASAGIGLLMELRAEAAARGVGLRVQADPGTVPARILALSGLDVALS